MNWIRRKCTIFWVITPCNLVEVRRSLRATCCLYFRYWSLSRARNQTEAGALVCCSDFSSTLKTEGICPSETSVDSYLATNHSHRYESLRSNMTWRRNRFLGTVMNLRDWWKRRNFLSTGEAIRFWITVPHGVSSLVIYIFSPVTYYDGCETSHLWDMKYFDVYNVTSSHIGQQM